MCAVKGGHSVLGGVLPTHPDGAGVLLWAAKAVMCAEWGHSDRPALPNWLLRYVYGVPHSTPSAPVGLSFSGIRANICSYGRGWLYPPPSDAVFIKRNEDQLVTANAPNLVVV